jgi:hypothetical protein
MKKCTKIYLVTNCYGDPNKVYIGKTTGSRRSKHTQTYGKYIIYTYIDEIDSLFRKDWEPLETYWIEQFRQWGFEIVNLRKKGGGGPEFRDEVFKEKMRKPHTEEHKQSLRKPKCYMPLKGPRSLETKQKIGLANSKPKPKGFGENHRIKMTGKISPKKGTGQPVIQMDVNNNPLKEWENVTIASNYFNKKPNQIYDCCSGRAKTAYGFKWKFKENLEI